MRNATSLSGEQLVTLGICLLALNGCPQLQQDDFRVVAVSSADAGSTDAAGGAGDPSSNAGSGGTNTGDGGFGGTSEAAGGVNSTGGIGGTSSTSDVGGTGDIGGIGGASSTSDVGGTGGIGGASSTGDTGGTGGTGDVGGTGGIGGASSTGDVGGTGGIGGAGSTGDTGGTGGIGGASGTGGLCNSGPFVNMELITGLNVTGEQWSPTLSADGLTIYFSIWDGTADRVWSATRNNRGSVFLPARQVQITGADNVQSTPFLSYSGLNLYFNVNSQTGTADRDIWIASRTDMTVASFANAQSLGGVNSTSSEGRPWLSNDELTVYFSSMRAGGSGDFDIWMATRTSTTAPFSTPTNPKSINSTLRDESPVLSNDRLTLYFATSRPGGLGQQDIWTATRTDTLGDFVSPTPLTVLNSTSIETDLALSHDETELFFASKSSGTPRIWRATRNCVNTGP